MEITPEQIRAARALLRIEQSDLAGRARVSVVTLRRIEAVSGSQRVAAATFEVVRRALEQAGAEFIPNGVRRQDAGRLDAASLFEDLRRISLRSAARLQSHEQLTEDDLYDENGLPA